MKEEIVSLIFPVNIRDPSPLITTYCADVLERLDTMDYEDFKTENPRQMIKIVLKHVKPLALKNVMFERVKVEAALGKKA